MGSHLVEALVARGKHVLIIDNLSTGRIANIQPAVSSGKATFVYADAGVETAALRQLLHDAKAEDIDAIYHFASPASPEAYAAHPWETLRVNSLGTMSLIEIALERQAMFFFASTSEVYGDPLVHPQTEEYFGNVNSIGPRACYDEGKRFGEAAVATGVLHKALNARIIRIFNCYGPRMQEGDGRLIPELICANLEDRPMPIQGTGKQTRSLTYISDLINFIFVVGKSQPNGVEPLNAGIDEEHTVEEIARCVARVMGKPFNVVYKPARPEDPQRRRPDLTRAFGLGWRPATNLEAGVQATCAWFTTQRFTQV